jgi:hypothetical protein
VQDQITARLEELKRDLSIGEAQLLELERQQAILRETLLRISGAIQVLEEELGRAGEPRTAPGAALGLAEPSNGKASAAPTLPAST